jgi:hypothetical protein
MRRGHSALSALIAIQGTFLLPAAEAYRTPEEVQAALHELAAASGGVLSFEPVAETRERRPVTAAVIAAPGTRPPAERQAILVVAGLEGNLPYTTELALEIARELVRRRGEPAVRPVLERIAIYLIPQGSPDGAARFFMAPRRETCWSSSPDDADRDYRTDEDAPNDLDGDGEILQLRIPDPEGPLVIDSADERILRAIRPGEEGSARFRVIEEGIDDDGDGLWNEDPPGGVDIASSFPHAYSRRRPGTGPFPASEPEAKGLLDFVLARPGIQASLAYGARDNLASPPEARDGPPEKDRGPDRTEHRFWKKDSEAVARLGERYRELTGAPKIPSARPEGSWHETAYFDLGLLSLAASPFGPEPPGTPAPGDEPAAKEKDRRKDRRPEGSDAQREERWLEWNDRVLGGAGFVKWKPFLHAELGPVHIGGWRPGSRSNPSPADARAMAPKQLEFLLDLAGKLPRVEIESLRVKELGDSLFEVKAAIVNHADLPTALVQGVYTTRRSPLNVEVTGAAIRFLGDGARRAVDSLDGNGGMRDFRWLILGPRGSTASLEVKLRGLPLASSVFRLETGASL